MAIIESFSPITRGTGSPEGKVAAPVGSVYTDTAATNGAIRWIKTSGTGNTGWRVQYGDTGWRSFKPSFLSVGVLLFRRTQNIVYLGPGEGRFRQLSLSSISPPSESVIPDGFRPTGTEFISLRNNSGKAAVGVLELANNGFITARMGETFTSPSIQLQGETGFYMTEEAWPATLPGTPA